MQVLLPAVLCSLLFLGACSNGDDDDSADPNPYAGYTSEQYEGQQNWLCHPNMADAKYNVCASDIAASIVFADGTTQLEPSPEAIDAPVDCFYVYPTVSSDAGGNSNLVADNEIRTTIIQAARYRSVCKLYAPLYRQVTVAGLSSSDCGTLRWPMAMYLMPSSSLLPGAMAVALCWWATPRVLHT